MNKRYGMWGAALLSLWLAGCASSPKSYVTLLESPDGSTGKIVVRGLGGMQTVDKARHAVPLDGSREQAPVDEAQFQKDFADALAARPRLPLRFLLYFETGGAQLTAESLRLLPTIIQTTGQYPGVDMSIVGHTDTVGRPENNETLALKRAQAVAELLQSQGLNIQRLSIESHGEGNPLVPTPDETAEPRNRRVEITVR